MRLSRTAAAVIAGTALAALAGCSAAPTRPAASPDPTPTADQTVTYTPKVDDWTISVKTLKKECFGSAGCNVTYRINPAYIGPATARPDTGVIEVTYQVTGGEDPQINTFTANRTQTSVAAEENLSTSSAAAILDATVTDVSYDAGGTFDDTSTP